MATAVESHESEVAVGLDLADLLAGVLVLLNDKVFQLQASVLLLTGPLKGLGPGLVAEPVADEVGVTCVDEDWDLLKESGNKAVVGLHPVTVEQEVAVDVEVARVVAIDLSTKCLTHVSLVEILADIAHALVAQVRLIFTLATDIVDVLAGALVGSQQSVVAVDGGGDTDPGTLAVVTSFNHLLATGESIVHGLAAALIKNGRVSTITTGHGAVVLVLSETIGQTISDENRLQVDVALLVGENLGSKHGNVMTGIRLASDVEVLLSVFRELLEEQGQKSIDVLAGSDGVANSAATVRVTDIDRLVQEDHGSIGVPRVVVVDSLDLSVD